MWKAYYRKFCHCAILQNGKSGYVFVENVLLFVKNINI
jgi:hypothetical protein